MKFFKIPNTMIMSKKTKDEQKEFLLLILLRVFIIDFLESARVSVSELASDIGLAPRTESYKRIIGFLESLKKKGIIGYSGIPDSYSRIFDIWFEDDPFKLGTSANFTILTSEEFNLLFSAPRQSIEQNFLIFLHIKKLTKNGTMAAYPSKQSLADSAGYARPTIDKILSSLQESGAISIHPCRKCYGDSISHSMNFYTVPGYDMDKLIEQTDAVFRKEYESAPEGSRHVLQSAYRLWGVLPPWMPPHIAAAMDASTESI